MCRLTGPLASPRGLGMDAMALCKSGNNYVNLLRSSTAGALLSSSRRASRQKSARKWFPKLPAAASRTCAMSADGSTRPDLQGAPEQQREVTDQDLRLLSEYTGIKDLDALRQHVYRVQKSAKEALWAYGCVQDFLFLTSRINRHSIYPQAQAALLNGHGSCILDVGCCFGQDTRRLELDGVPHSSIYATDIVSDYWAFGKELFIDAESQNAHTAWGSFADPEFIQSGVLAPMMGKFAYVWAGAVLHVLTKEDVSAFLAHAHAMLAPNGTFFGMCGGRDPPGEWQSTPTPTGKGVRHLHNEETLAALLKEVGFSSTDVRRTTAADWGVQAAQRSAAQDDVILLSFAATK